MYDLTHHVPWLGKINRVIGEKEPAGRIDQALANVIEAANGPIVVTYVIQTNLGIER